MATSSRRRNAATRSRRTTTKTMATSSRRLHRRPRCCRCCLHQHPFRPPPRYLSRRTVLKGKIGSQDETTLRRSPRPRRPSSSAKSSSHRCRFRTMAARGTAISAPIPTRNGCQLLRQTTRGTVAGELPAWRAAATTPSWNFTTLIDIHHTTTRTSLGEPLIAPGEAGGGKRSGTTRRSSATPTSSATHP